MTAPAGSAGRSARRRVGVVLAVDFVALSLVVAFSGAAWGWLDGSRPTDAIASSPTAGFSGAVATPIGSSSAGPSEVTASASLSASPSPVPSATPTPAGGVWTPAESTPYALWGAGSTLLNDGRVLVVGGTSTASSATAVARTEVYDPTTGHWTATTDMLHARAYAMVVTLKDGSVLAAGGAFGGVPLTSAERYVPDYGGWMQAGSMSSPRTQGTITLLADGRVLVAGGGSVGAPSFAATSSAELYDPATNTWTVAASMSMPRTLHTATLLHDGEVLVAGGATRYTGGQGTVTSSAEIYDPKADAWHAAASMSVARYIHSATRLGNGHVLVVGGWAFTTSFDASLETAEVYDPASNGWTPTGSMAAGRARFSLVSLNDGRLLAAGGVGPTYHMLATAELWDPGTGHWQATGSLGAAVMWPALAVLQDGRTLIAGGALDPRAARTTSVCAIYSPPPR
jgi:N-acetylneuraminic acid mutarotase